jgi:hypothetical protein
MRIVERGIYFEYGEVHLKTDVEFERLSGCHGKFEYSPRSFHVGQRVQWHSRQCLSHNILSYGVIVDLKKKGAVAVISRYDGGETEVKVYDLLPFEEKPQEECKCKKMKERLKQAYELLTEEWVPTAEDKQRFIESLKEYA